MSQSQRRLAHSLNLLLAVVFVFSLVAVPASAAPVAQGADEVTITILHNNDFHGNLEPAGSNPGIARLGQAIKDVRAEVGAENVVLLDAGDNMQGSLLSNLFNGKPTIDLYNYLGYQATTFGNHEFDWGQQVLQERIGEASFPYVTSNIVVNDTGNCATAGWTTPAWAEPFTTITAGPAGSEVKVGVIGVTTPETPYITIASATEGLCFKDPADSIIHHYDAMKAAGAQVIVVLSHLGYTDGGYGYGFAVYGDQTLAKKLAAAGKKPDLIIGGHSHTDLAAATIVDGVAVVQAHYAGRKLGRATVTVNKTTGAVSVAWQRIALSSSSPEDPDTKARVALWTNDPWYQGEITRVVGYTNVDLVRNYNGDSTMGAFVNDAIYNDLNTDAVAENDVDIVFNNAGGLRNDILTGGTMPFTLTHGLLFNVLPFGNQTVVGTMTGAEVMDVLNQSATLFKGAIQVAGIRYSFYNYTDALPGPQPWAWGAFSVTVKDRATGQWQPLDVSKTYDVATNEFLAPAGQDGFQGFKYLKDNTYWGDMLDGVERWVSTTYSITNPYDEALDGRITRVGTAAGGPVVPVTILHHNDSHGRLMKSGNFQGLTQLATLIKQERAHNPDRTLLFSLGDNVQGDSMMYYLKNAGDGVTADGTTLPPSLWVNPFIAAMNAMSYNGMVLGNHEFNFGAEVFRSTFSKAAFPLLGANVTDSGAYGINKVALDPAAAAQSVKVNVHDGLEYSLLSGDPDNPIKLGFVGLTNHRVPIYELPSNIPGLSFSNPLAKAEELVPVLDGRNDAVVALTHIGFTTDPKSVEVDENVDTNLAKTVAGIDAVLGSHSHTNPTTGAAPYKFLPAIVPGPNNVPVLVNQAYRYNTFLGKVIIGLLPKAEGGFDVVTRAGVDIAVDINTPEDPTIKAIVDPYQAIITAYNNTEIGQTTVPIDTLKAYTEETNGANLQADASVWELERNGVQVDFHLSGAMTNRKIADAATPASPVTLKVSDMFQAMPYENSLLVLRMNGPQLKAVLERAYRNYYFYKYVPGYGGYSYYTTCMIDTDAGNVIRYADNHPEQPNGNNVLSLTIQGTPVDFSDATKFYNVSTVNYLAAGSCNFNNSGKTLWPLDQIVADTQLYVRDAVIAYVKAQTGPISPAVEGRLQFAAQENKVYLPLVWR
jgi:2',3'-cyclic-nucleotide 2'-phosphodiesterase (5'-nucleotidase family)